MPNVIQILLNKSIFLSGPKNRNKNSIIVNPIYIRYKILAVAETLDTNLPTDGPGDSARRICMLDPSLSSGRIAKIKTITPIPPIQWENERQNNMLCDNDSTSVHIDAPVVVKPEDISKKASKKFGISLLITSGNAPTIATTIHDNATIINEDRGNIFLLFGLGIFNNTPTTNDPNAVIKKANNVVSHDSL